LDNEYRAGVSWSLITDEDQIVSSETLDETWLLNDSLCNSSVVCCGFDDVESVDIFDIVSHFRRLPNPGATFVILVPRRRPPELSQRGDDEILWFSASLGVLRAFNAARSPETGFSCYELLFWLLEAKAPKINIECLQIPTEPSWHGSPNVDRVEVEWIIPHKGPLAFLHTCLNSVDSCRASSDVVSVCFDEEVSSEHRNEVQAFPWATFYSSEPFGNGPYVGRERLAQTGTTPFVIFQDSDDVSTPLRRRLLLSKMLETGADFIGSHEIHVNYFERKVFSVRYPLDVTAALAAHPGHPLLLPTSAIRRDALHAAGGFSTIRSFNSDLEFVMRAFFFLRMINIDEFLYIRRVRPGSLTRVSETGFFSQARQDLTAAWRRDFERIKHEGLRLEDSSLKRQDRVDFSSIRIVQLGQKF
jgi:hypothetical protein